MTSELRPADSPWECFRDEAYYGMWCLRRENWRTFGQGFHLMRGEEAQALRDLLNEQAAELAKWKALAETLAEELQQIEVDAMEYYNEWSEDGCDQKAAIRFAFELGGTTRKALTSYKEQRDA